MSPSLVVMFYRYTEAKAVESYVIDDHKHDSILIKLP